MGSRTWIKIYCDRWLNGTIHEETPEVRGIWVDLLALAGSGKYGDSGEIKITDEIGFLDQQIANLLQISTRKWKIISKRLQDTDRICVHKNNVIAIINWAKYQSEYERTKRYRTQGNETESTAGSTAKGTDENTAREGEGRGERGDNPSPPPPLLENAHEKLAIPQPQLADRATKVSSPRDAQKNKLIQKKLYKRKYGEFQNVLLTDAEYQRLKERFNDHAEKLIEDLSRGLASRGYKYKSHYATILNWHHRDERKENDAKTKDRRLPKTYTPTPDYPDL